MDFAVRLWIPRKLDRVYAPGCLMCYKLEKKHFYLYWVWLCFPHCNWHHIFLTASLKSLIWRGSQRPTSPGTIRGFKSAAASPLCTLLSWMSPLWAGAGSGKAAGSSFMPSTCTWNSISQDGHEPVTFRNTPKHPACFVVRTSVCVRATVPWGQFCLKKDCLLS